MKVLGRHVIADLCGCSRIQLDDLSTVERVLTSAVRDSGATLIKTSLHHFSPQGVSGVAIIAESHFSIHTWPEHCFAAVDMFTCGDLIDLERALDTICLGFHPTSVKRIELSRGVPDASTLSSERDRQLHGTAEWVDPSRPAA